MPFYSSWEADYHWRYKFPWGLEFKLKYFTHFLWKLISLASWAYFPGGITPETSSDSWAIAVTHTNPSSRQGGWIFCTRNVCYQRLLHCKANKGKPWCRKAKILTSNCKMSDVPKETSFSEELSWRRLLYLNTSEARCNWSRTLPKMRLYFNFSSQLMFYTTLLKLWFEEHFQCKNKFTLLLTCEVHISKFSFPQRATNFKIIKRPLPPARAKRRLEKLDTCVGFDC